MMMACYSEGPL